MRSTRHDQSPVVRAASGLDEARAVWDIDTATFGGAIPWELGKTWFEAYPAGLFVLERGSTLEGYISFWPLNSNAEYSAFVAGRIAEEALLITAPSARAHSFWYIGSVWANRPWFAGRVLQGAFDLWCASLAVGSTATVCAVGFAAAGCRLLAKCGFATAGRSRAAQLPIYERRFVAGRHEHLKIARIDWGQDGTT